MTWRDRWGHLFCFLASMVAYILMLYYISKRS